MLPHKTHTHTYTQEEEDDDDDEEEEKEEEEEALLCSFVIVGSLSSLPCVYLFEQAVILSLCHQKNSQELRSKFLYFVL